TEGHQMVFSSITGRLEDVFEFTPFIARNKGVYLVVAFDVNGERLFPEEWKIKRFRGTMDKKWRHENMANLGKKASGAGCFFFLCLRYGRPCSIGRVGRAGFV